MTVLDRFLDDTFCARCDAARAGMYLPSVSELVLGMPMLNDSLRADAIEASKQAIKADDLDSAFSGRMMRSSELYEALFELARGPSMRRMRAVADACRADYEDELHDAGTLAELQLRMRCYLALLGDRKSATSISVLAMLGSCRRPMLRVSYTLAASGWNSIAYLCSDNSSLTRTAPSSDNDERIDDVAIWYSNYWTHSVGQTEYSFRTVYSGVPQ